MHCTTKCLCKQEHGKVCNCISCRSSCSDWMLLYEYREGLQKASHLHENWQQSSTDGPGKSQICTCDCHEALKTLAEINKVTLLWVPGHLGDARAWGSLAVGRVRRRGCTHWGRTYIWACIPYGSGVYLLVGFKQNQKHWDSTYWQKHAKRMLQGPLRSTQTDALRNRKDHRKVIGFITGCWSCYGASIRMGI